MTRKTRKIKRSRLNRRVSQKSRKVKKSRSRSRSRKVRRTRRKRMRGGAESSFPWKTRKDYGDDNPNRLQRIRDLHKMTPDEILSEINQSKSTGEFDAMLQEHLSHMHDPHESKYPNFPTAGEVAVLHRVEEGTGAGTQAPGHRQFVQSAEKAGAMFALNAAVKRVGESKFKGMNIGERMDAVLEDFTRIDLPPSAFEHIPHDMYMF